MSKSSNIFRVFFMCVLVNRGMSYGNPKFGVKL